MWTSLPLSNRSQALSSGPSRLDLYEILRKRKESYVHTPRMRRRKRTIGGTSLPGPENKRGACDRTGTHTSRRGRCLWYLACSGEAISSAQEAPRVYPATKDPWTFFCEQRTSSKKILAQEDAYPAATFHKHGDCWEQERGMGGKIRTRSCARERMREKRGRTGNRERTEKTSGTYPCRLSRCIRFYQCARACVSTSAEGDTSTRGHLMTNRRSLWCPIYENKLVGSRWYSRVG